MYPSPSSAYRPQVQQPQFTPQATYPAMTNQNSQSMPPSSSAYPYQQQYTPNPNTAQTTQANSYLPPTYPGQVGQPPPFQQPMTYGMGGNPAATAQQPPNNINAPFAVCILINE